VIAPLHKAAFTNCKRSFHRLNVFLLSKIQKSGIVFKRIYKNLHTVFGYGQPKTLTVDISNSLGVIVLTDKHTNTQTDTTENNTTLTAWVVNTQLKPPHCHGGIWVGVLGGFYRVLLFFFGWVVPAAI